MKPPNAMFVVSHVSGVGEAFPDGTDVPNYEP